MADFWTCRTSEPGGGTLLSAALVAWPPVEVEAGFEDPDDPPHAVSSRISEPSPAAAAKPLLRITTLHSRFSVPWGASGVHRLLRDATPFPIRRKRTRLPGRPTAS